MTRKDYIAMAHALFATRPRLESDEDTICGLQWNQDVRAIADVLQADNDRFRREQFIAACGGLIIWD